MMFDFFLNLTISNIFPQAYTCFSECDFYHNKTNHSSIIKNIIDTSAC